MGDEQIMKAAKEIVREFVRECDYTPEDDETAARVIRSVASSARREALEEAARHCIEGAVDIGCSALEAEGVVRRTREALAASVRALAGESGGVEGEG